MRAWGFALFILLCVLPAVAQEDQPAPPPPVSESRSPTADAGKGADESPAAAASAEAKPAEAKLDLTPDVNGKLSQEQMEHLLRVVADKGIENQKRERDYTYIERDVTNKLDGSGKTKSTDIDTYEVLELYGEQVQRLIEKEDKPLGAKEAAKEEEKIQKIIDKRKNESEEERKKREEKDEKDREEGLKFLREVADAYNFNLMGTELVGGREAWEIEAEPRPGFEPHMKGANLLPKVHGRVWIDKGDLQLARMDVEAIDTVAFGWFLARIHKGTHAMFEQTRVNDEVWLPRHVTFKVDARVALLKNYRLDGDVTYRDYKKFRTSARIVGVREAPTTPDSPKPEMLPATLPSSAKNQ